MNKFCFTCCQVAPSSLDTSRIAADPPPLGLLLHEVAILNCSVKIVLENLINSVTADVFTAPLYKTSLFNKTAHLLVTVKE